MPNLFDSDTNKQGLIVYGGESSSSYGMVVAEAPAFERPKRKQTIYNVPGRNGSIIFQQDAWEDVTRSYKVWLTPSSNKTLVERVDALEAWLNSQNGYVRLEDNFEPDVYRLAYYSGGDGFSNSLTQYGEATLNFTCRPERFLKSGEIPISARLDNPYLVVNVNNPTRFYCYPLISIRATSNAQIEFDNMTVTMPAPSMTIDYDARAAYYNDGATIANYWIEFTGSQTFKPIPPQIGKTFFIDVLSGTLNEFTVTPRYFTI